MVKQAPGSILSAELRAVSSAASAFLKALKNHNYLPNSFPVFVLELECEALSALHFGSLETAQVVLEHAIVRLSDVRRNHFVLVDGSENTEELSRQDESESPHLERGDALDREMVYLISSVSTALDGIRAQLQLEYLSSASDQYIEAVRGSDVAVSSSQAIDSARELGGLGAAANADEFREEESVAHFGRSAIDAKSSILATAAESSSNVVIAGWLRKLSKHTASALSVLRLSIVGVRAAGEVAYDFYKKYQESIGKVEGSIVSEVSSWLNELEARLSGFEAKLAELADNGRAEYGVTRYLQGQLIVVGADGSPFSMESNTMIKPLGNSIVSFTRRSIGGVQVASNIRQARNVIFVDGKFFHPSEAKPELENIAHSLFSESRISMSSKRFEKSMLAQSVVPVHFWRIMGYNDFDQWAESVPRLHLLGDAGSRKNRFYSDRILAIRPPALESFLDWAYEEILKSGGRSRLGELATLAQTNLLKQNGIPLRALYKRESFGDLFSGDSRFLVEKDMISLTDLQEKTDS